MARRRKSPPVAAAAVAPLAPAGTDATETGSLTVAQRERQGRKKSKSKKKYNNGAKFPAMPRVAGPLRVNFNTDTGIKYPKEQTQYYQFREREAYHPLVGFTVEEYAKFQDEKFETHGVRSNNRSRNLKLHSNSHLWQRAGMVAANPFAGPGDWKKPVQGQQQSALVKVFQVHDLAYILIEMLAKMGHKNIAAVSGTCQIMSAIAATVAKRWDVVVGDFNNTECLVGGTEWKLMSSDERAQLGVGGSFLSVVSSKMLVHPERYGYKPDDSSRVAISIDNHRYIDKVYHRKFQRPVTTNQYDKKNLKKWDLHRFSYQDELLGLIRLCRSLHQYGRGLRVLHLHRVPILDYRSVSAIVAGLPSLEALGVYQCEMMHIGQVLPLLDIVYTHNAETQAKSSMNLDFYPRYNETPKLGIFERIGSFGISCQNLIDAPVQQGIFQIWACALLKSRRLGIDISSRGTAFRQFMEDIPLHRWSVPDFLDAFFTYHLWERYPGRLDFMEMAAVRNDVIAVVARNTLPDLVRGISLERKKMNDYAKFMFCHGCGMSQWAIFYENPLLDRGDSPMPVCAGCRLRACLDAEETRYKVHKRKMLDEALGGEVTNIPALRPPPIYVVGSRGMEFRSDSADDEAAAAEEEAARRFVAPLHPSSIMRPGKITSKNRIDLKRYFDTFDKVPPLEVLGSSELVWLDSLIQAWKLDLRHRDHLERGSHLDDDRYFQCREDNGTTNQLFWDALRQKDLHDARVLKTATPWWQFRHPNDAPEPALEGEKVKPVPKDEPLASGW